MSINKSLLKRIIAVENALRVSHSPELITIAYDSDKGKYIVKETFMNNDGAATKTACSEIDSLDQYIFDPDFMGVCIMDLFNAPLPEVCQNLFSLRATEIRATENIPCGIGFKFHINEEQPEDLIMQVTVNKC